MLHIFQPLITFQYDVGHFQLFIESQDGVTHTLVDQASPTLGAGDGLGLVCLSVAATDGDPWDS